MRKLVSFLLLFLSLAANVALAMALVNTGVVVDGATTVAEDLWERRQEALEILNFDWVGRSVQELDELVLAMEAQGVLVSRDGETREIGDFLFRVENGEVSIVEDFDGLHD